MTQPDVLKHAIWYAKKLGWHVFPVHNQIFNAAGKCTGCTCEYYRRSEQCKKDHAHLYLSQGEKCAGPGKCPRVRWLEKSTTDTETIKKWFGKPWRDVDIETGAVVYNIPNIGIDCGKSGILVFDNDKYKKNYAGANLLTLPDQQTVTVLTGRGEQLIYDRQGKPYGNSSKNLPNGIDIRGDGGYIVTTPSLHYVGRRYQFEIGYGPHEIEFLPIPPGLDAILRTATARRGADAGESDIFAVNRSAKLVEATLERAEIDHYGREEYGEGRRWVLQTCPFNPKDDEHAADKSAFILVLQDGRITAGCHHNRCQKRIEKAGSGWNLLRACLKIK